VISASTSAYRTEKCEISDARRVIQAGADAIPWTIKKLISTRGDIWDAGKYKDKDSDIIEKYPDGRERVRFRAVPAAKTKDFTHELVEMWNRSLHERWVHPLLPGGFNLDFLCIHRLGRQWRVSRLSSCSGIMGLVSATLV
jgi:hypothetical protein